MCENSSIKVREHFTMLHDLKRVQCLQCLFDAKSIGVSLECDRCCCCSVFGRPSGNNGTSNIIIARGDVKNATIT